MKFSLEIDCNNAAFEGDPTAEIARLLRAVADAVPSIGIGGRRLRNELPLFDADGNRVGSAELTQ